MEHTGGYKKALREGKLTLIDVCDIIGRLPTEEESELAGGLTDEERKSIFFIRWFAKKLSYRYMMNTPGFMGSFVFMQAFSYWIYHVLLILFGCIVGPYPGWIALAKNIGLWLPLLLAFITKFLMGTCIHERVLHDDPPYHRGIRYPHAFTLFDTLYSMIGAILGWASALTRLFSSFFVTLLLLPRLDVSVSEIFVLVSAMKYLYSSILHILLLHGLLFSLFFTNTACTPRERI